MIAIFWIDFSYLFFLLFISTLILQVPITLVLIYSTGNWKAGYYSGLIVFLFLLAILGPGAFGILFLYVSASYIVIYPVVNYFKKRQEKKDIEDNKAS